MNIKNHKMDNRGLTLVELIVAVAISTVVIAAIWQFMLISTRSYQSQKTITDLQQEVQQTMNQAENLIIDVNRAVNYIAEPDATEKTLEAYSANKISKLIWNANDYTLMYSETSVVDGEVQNDTEIALLAKGVKEFDVDTSKVESDRILKIRMMFERNDKTYEATRNITLRNMVAKSGNTADIYLNDKPATTPEASIVFTDPIPTELVPGKTYNLKVEVANAANPKVLWTVLGKTSNNTEIDVETGKLTVSIDEGKEIENHEITIVVTLESNRNVFVSKTFKVTEAPAAAISISEFPEWVIYGDSYDVAAVAEPDMYEDYVIWKVVGQGTSVDAKVENGKLIVGSTAQNQIEVQASVKVDATTTVVESAVAQVRHPEFEVLVDGYKTYSNLTRGNVIELTADWSKSYSGKTVNYASGTMDGQNVSWTYKVGNDGDWQEVTSNEIELPISLGVGSVTVKGVAENGISCVQELGLSVPSLSVNAYDGTTLLNDTLVPIGKSVTLKAVLSGMNSSKASYSWSVKTADGKTVSTSAVTGTKDVSFTLDNTYVGKQLVVTVTETNSANGQTKVTGTRNLTVATVQVCSKENLDSLLEPKQYKYLHVNGYGENQSPFFIPVENMNDAEERVTVYVDGEALPEGAYADVIHVTELTSGYLCTPVHTDFDFGYENIDYIIIHIDNIKTGEHIAMYKMIPVLTNFEASNGRDFLIPKTVAELNKTGNGNNDKTYGDFCNFYGSEKNAADWEVDETSYPEAKEYDVQYEYWTERSWFGGSTTYYCRISVISNNATIGYQEYRWSSSKWNPT